MSAAFRGPYFRFVVWSGVLAAFLGVRLTMASDPSETKKAEAEVVEVSLPDGERTGQIAVKAEGLGDGRMAVSVENKSRKRLRVILPPSLVAVGATGALVDSNKSHRSPKSTTPN